MRKSKKNENAVAVAENENAVAVAIAENVENVVAVDVSPIAAHENAVAEIAKRFEKTDFSAMNADVASALNAVRESTVLQNVHGKRIDTDFAVMEKICDVFALHDISAVFPNWKYGREKKCIVVKSNGNTVCFIWGNKRDIRLTVSQGTNVTDKATQAISAMTEEMQKLFAERQCYKVSNAQEKLENEYSFFYDEIVNVVKAYTSAFDAVMSARAEKKKSAVKRPSVPTYADIAEYAKTHTQDELLAYIAEHANK